MRVELLRPAAPGALPRVRRELWRMLRELGLPTAWQEFAPGDPQRPLYLRGGRGGLAVFADGRRLWSAGADPDDAELAALRRALERAKARGGRRGVVRAVVRADVLASSAQAFAIALFPKCALCWAAYTGALGSVGLGTLPYQPWLLPVLYLSVGIYLLSLWKGAAGRNGYGPALAGAAGAALLLLDTLAREDVRLRIGGFVLILAASVWNGLPAYYFRARRAPAQA